MFRKSTIALISGAILVFAVMSAPNLADPRIGSSSGGLQYIVEQVMWGPLGKVFLTCIVVAVTVEIAANPHGMGYALMLAQQSLDPALMLAWLGWIGAVGYAINVGALALQRWAARRMGGTLA